MIFDEHGLPKDNGATDYMDSARLIGLMAVIARPIRQPIDRAVKLSQYVKYNSDGVLVAMRHPYEVPSNNWKNFTRDQLMCLAAGFYSVNDQGTARKLYYAAKNRGCRAQNTEFDVDGSVKKFPNGADILTPSHMNHLRRCAGLQPTLIGNLWLKMDILYNAKFSPMSEPNQLVCMLAVAGPEYVNMWKKHNKQWKDAIKSYWWGWRGEADLALDMITYLEQY